MADWYILFQSNAPVKARLRFMIVLCIHAWGVTDHSSDRSLPALCPTILFVTEQADRKRDPALVLCARAFPPFAVERLYSSCSPQAL